MGKKKQKVRWTAVEENFFNGHDDSGSGSDSTSRYGENNNATKPGLIEVGGPFPVQHSNKPFPPRRYGTHWSSAPLAPRFERKAAAEAAKAAGHNGHNGSGMTVYYDGECCETEQLPDGFTKIRSKNLDVLFKRDYYSHKIEFSRSNCSSEPGDEDLGSDEEEEEEEEGEYDNDGDTEVAETEAEEKKESPIKDQAKKEEGETAKNINNNNNNTEEENGSAKSYQISSYPYSPNAPPFVPSSQSRPNLFLYSPSSNTMIPCEEIIIPNPVMGPDGPMYQGPSNIYLAFPMENSPNGNNMSPTGGYISAEQSFIPPNQLLPGAMQFDQYGVPYQPYHPLQPPQTITVEHTGVRETITTVYQSASSEGGTEPSSADSTTPHSPPDLSAYSPSNWANAHFDHGIASPPNGGYTHVNHPPSWYNKSCNSNLRNISEGDEESPQSHVAEQQNGLPCHADAPDFPREGGVSQNNLKSHIPGLNPDLLNGVQSSNGKRVQKKRRRRKVMPVSPQKEATKDNNNGVGTSEEVYYPEQNTEMKVTKILSRTSSSDAADRAKEESSIQSPVTEVKANISVFKSQKAEEEEEIISCSVNPASSNSSESSFATSLPSSEANDVGAKNEASISMAPEYSLVEMECNNNNNTEVTANDECLSRAVTTTIECDDKTAIQTPSEKEDNMDCNMSRVGEELVPDDALPETCPLNLDGAPGTSVLCIEATNAEDLVRGEVAKEEEEEEKQEDKIAQQPHKSPWKAVPDMSRKNRKKLNKRVSKKDLPNNHQCNNQDEEELRKVTANRITTTEDKTLYSSVVRHEVSATSDSAFDPSESLGGEVTVEKKMAQDGEWETKKRRSRRGNNKKFVGNISPPTCQEKEVLHVEEKNLFLEEVKSEEKPVQDSPAAPPVTEDRTSENKTENSEVSTEVVASESISSEVRETKRSVTRKNKKKRYSSYEAIDAKTSTHQVLIQDGFIDFSQGPQRRSSSYEPSSDTKKGHLDTLFISSIGHGIQQGPLFMGRLGQGKYNPPDRSEEIPLKYRESEDKDEEKKNDEEEKEEGEEGGVTEAKNIGTTNEELALD